MVEQIIILGLVTAERVGELALARRNTAALLARGGIEYGAGHFPVIVALHGGWLVALWLLALDQPVNGWWLGAYLVLQGFRAWILTTLAGRWTARIIIVPGETLVRAGPYRFLKHPNYVLVWCEIIMLPLVFGLSGVAVVFGVLNTAVLWWRIRVENAALASLQ